MKVFLTYGDSDFYLSKNIIKQEVKKIRVFDKIIAIGPNDIPELYRQSSLMEYKKGGGYWIWKPYIIYQTLLNLKEGDIVVYADAGCEMLDSYKWEYYFSFLEKNSVLLFEYDKSINYGWGENKDWRNSVKASDWTKKKTLDYFYNENDVLKYSDINIILAGVIFCKKDENSILFFKGIFEIMKNNPDLVLDPVYDELKEQYKGFIEHRHDQSIITFFAHCYKSRFNINILTEEFEKSDRVLDRPAILTKRRKIGKYDFLKYFNFLVKKFFYKFKKY